MSQETLKLCHVQNVRQQQYLIYILGYSKLFSGFQQLPPRSPDATPCDFFHWGYVKDLMWNKKPTRCYLLLYLFSLYKLLNMFRATLCPSSGTDYSVVYRRVWCSAVAAVGWQNRLAACVSIEEYVAQLALLRGAGTGGWPGLSTRPSPTPTRLVVLRIPQWIHKQLTGSASLQQPRLYITRGDKTTESSAPEDGHKVARNMLSNL